MYKVVDSYVTNVFISPNEIDRIRILYDKPMKMKAWYNKHKPDILINAAFFNMTSGIPIENFISDSKTISTSSWCNEGFGIKHDGTISFGKLDQSYKDFMVAFPTLVKGGKININFDVGSSLSGKSPRSLISYNAKSNELILTTIDGRQKDKPGKTIFESATYIMQHGVEDSINMDGGGSTRMLVNGKVVNSPSEDRPVSSVIAIWLKKVPSYAPKEESTSVLNITKIECPKEQYSTKCPYFMTPTRIVVHNTANDASARNEIKNLHRLSNKDLVSFHIAVDDKEAIQGIDFNRNTWNAGDGRTGPGNMQGIAIEICYSKSGGARFEKAQDNAAKLIAKMLKERGWGIDKVTKHQDYSGKYCPHRTLSDYGWTYFLDLVKSYMNEDKHLTELNSEAYEEVAKEVIRGKWGNGENRKKKLQKAGYDYEKVQKLVNELLKK